MFLADTKTNWHQLTVFKLGQSYLEALLTLTLLAVIGSPMLMDPPQPNYDVVVR